LSARAILDEAYRAGIVPYNLYGKTQHKTLQARISENIARKKSESPFFRTGPGRFFLTEFLDDASIAKELRTPFAARRRFREIWRGPALAIHTAKLRETAQIEVPLSPRRFFGLMRATGPCYCDPHNGMDNVALIRSFVCVTRKNEILSYRLGRYREDRDGFISRRSIGFSTLVSERSCTLFNKADLGIVDSGVRAAITDLDIPFGPADNDAGFLDSSISYFVWCLHGTTGHDLLAIVNYSCPGWFEPLKRRLALNDVCWMDLRNRVNNLEDFDPWSKLVLNLHYKGRFLFGNKHGAKAPAA
jgi:hypothetical protein